MGCAGSSNKETQEGVPKKKGPNQPKIPVRLFYIPGPVKDAFIKCISPRLNSASNDNPQATLNLRFIDSRIQRDARRHWIQDAQDNQNVACSIFLVDIRDHPNMLLTARCVNWFTKSSMKTGPLKTIVIYDMKSQLEEFCSLIPSNVELLPMNTSKPESLDAFSDYMKTVEQQYTEKRTNWTTTRL